MKHEILDNTVIRCTSPGQGQKIKAFFLLCGVGEDEMRALQFDQPNWYYGLLHGRFNVIPTWEIKKHDLRIVELPSEEFLANNLGLPCEMVVMDDDDDFDRDFTQDIIAWVPCSNEPWIGLNRTNWSKAKHILPKKEKQKISMQELFEKAGLSADDYIIE
jgi:hypothetical protein